MPPAGWAAAGLAIVFSGIFDTSRVSRYYPTFSSHRRCWSGGVGTETAMTRRGCAAPRRDGAFDAFGLEARGQEIAGKVDASSLPRVADRLAPGAAPIQWRISRMTDASGRPALEVRLDGEVPLECQRCLRPFNWPVAQS